MSAQDVTIPRVALLAQQHSVPAKPCVVDGVPAENCIEFERAGMAVTAGLSSTALKFTAVIHDNFPSDTFRTLVTMANGINRHYVSPKVFVSPVDSDRLQLVMETACPIGAGLEDSQIEAMMEDSFAGFDAIREELAHQWEFAQIVGEDSAALEWLEGQERDDGSQA